MTNKEFFLALEQLEKEKKISKEVFISSLESGLSSAYKRETGVAMPVMIKLNPERNVIRVFAYQTVVEEVEDEDKEISLADAKRIKNSYKVGDLAIIAELSPKLFTRIAAQTAKQVIMQRLNDVTKAQIKDEMTDKEGEILSAVVRRVEGNNVYVEILSTMMEGVLSQTDQIRSETYKVGDVIKVYIKKLRDSSSGNIQVMVSRSHPLFVEKLFEMEVPEIKSGLVIIKKVVREAGYRSKIAVYSDDPNVDAVGACIGPKGSRINNIVRELGGERIDIIPWCADPLEFIARAISPAKAAMVQVNDDEKSARVIVNDNMLSLAIGKEGQNARLAARLTEWKIDIKPYSAIMGEEGDGEGEI